MVLADNAGLMTFASLQFGTVRAIGENGETWFIASDVCSALGLANVTNAVRRLDDDETTLISIKGREMNAVNESGLYSLVLSSRKPEAKDFKRWITHDVVPAIRRTGGYIAAKADETPEEVMARALRIADDTMRRQKARIDAMEAEAAELRPKAIFADAVAASDGTCLVGELAKMARQNGVPIGQNRMFAWLREGGWLGKSGCNRNVPTQRSMEMGLFRVKETAVTHSDGRVTVTRTPKVTGKGQAYFMAKLVEGAV